MNEQGNSWPEQDAVNKWWREHRLELMDAVSAYRVSIEKRTTEPREDVREKVRDGILAVLMEKTFKAQKDFSEGPVPSASMAGVLTIDKLLDEATDAILTLVTKPIVWCRCGDGIEDPKCKTCYMTDRLDTEPTPCTHCQSTKEWKPLPTCAACGRIKEGDDV